MNPLSFKLQKREIDVYQAYNHIGDFKRDLQNIRGDIEKHCTDWYNMATTTVRKTDIEPSMPRVVGQQQHRSNVEAESPKEYYKRALTIPLQDHLISEMDSYFDPNNDAVMSSLLCVLPALLVSQEGNPVQAAIQYYADDLPSPQVADVELACWRRKWLSAYQTVQFRPWQNVTAIFIQMCTSCCASCIAKVPKNRVKKGMRGELEAPDYYPEVDPFEDMDVDNLFNEPVMPQNEKQIVPKPPTYEESLKDLLEGKKEIYVDPQYFPEYEDELPPEYDEDEIDYALDADDEVSEILDDVGIDDYDVVQMKLDQPEMTPKKTKNYLNKILEKAKYKRRQLKGFKANVTKEYNRGTISEAERQIKNKRINNARVALNDYIKHYESKAKTIKSSGI
ncbi:hypothetical protein ACROYT_G029707 [Oculina patagonica]